MSLKQTLGLLTFQNIEFRKERRTGLGVCFFHEGTLKSLLFYIPDCTSPLMLPLSFCFHKRILKYCSCSNKGRNVYGIPSTQHSLASSKDHSFFGYASFGLIFATWLSGNTEAGITNGSRTRYYYFRGSVTFGLENKRDCPLIFVTVVLHLPCTKHYL